MSDFGITASHNNITFPDKGYLEVPIQGPGQANLLVILCGMVWTFVEWDDATGIALDEVTIPGKTAPGLGVYTSGTQFHAELYHGDLTIFTGYTLRPEDDNLTNSDSLLQTTYICLANIEHDDDGNDIVLAVDEAWTDITTQQNTREVTIHATLGLQGDCTMSALSYQVHLLLHREDMSTPAEIFSNLKVPWMIRREYQGGNVMTSANTPERKKGGGAIWPSLQEQIAAAKVVPGSALEKLIQDNQDFHMLRREEANDNIGIPPWLRVYWRKHHPEAVYSASDPTGGYPRSLKRVQEWMIQHQDLQPR